MKLLTLTRTSRQEGFTTGALYEGDELLGHTLEPQWRDLKTEKKVDGKTAIPEGTYEIRLFMSPRFGRLMPYLMDVPGFTGILIHCGNTVTDTKGCILVGMRGVNGTLRMSRATFKKLYERLFAAYEHGEKIMLTIK